jgi:choline dehydrogenase
MADAFLHPIAHRKNLSLRTSCAVQRLIFDDDISENSSHRARMPPRAMGVEWTEGNRLKRAAAAREVILCTGAVASPQLLQVSALSTKPERCRASVRFSENTRS